MTPKMPRADRQDIFQINSTGTTRCSRPKKWSSCEGTAVTWQQISNWDEEAGSVRQTAISLSSTVVDRQDTSLVTRCPVAAKCFKCSCEWAVSCHNTGLKLRRRGFIRQPAISFSLKMYQIQLWMSRCCHNTGFKLRRRRLYKTTSYLFLSLKMYQIQLWMSRELS